MASGGEEFKLLLLSVFPTWGRVGYFFFFLRKKNGQALFSSYQCKIICVLHK